MFLITDTKLMIDDINNHSFWLGVWGKALNIPQVIGGIIFLPRIEAFLVLIACVGSVLVAAQIHKKAPFSRLTSWVHLPWLALLPYLFASLRDEGVGTFFGLWLAYVAVTMVVCLALNVRNLYLYYLTDNSQFEGVSR